MIEDKNLNEDEMEKPDGKRERGYNPDEKRHSGSSSDVQKDKINQIKCEGDPRNKEPKLEELMFSVEEDTSHHGYKNGLGVHGMVRAFFGSRNSQGDRRKILVIY